MDEGKGSVAENGAENFKMAEGTSMFTTALVRHSTSGTVVMQHELQDCFWKTDDSKFWIYPQPRRCLSEKKTHLSTENWDSQFYIYAMHWSCSIATAHNTAHGELDVTKFVYS
jgi:hypothetical protein